MRGLY